MAPLDPQSRLRLLESAFEELPTAVAIVDGSDLVFEYANPAYQAFAPGKEIVGRTISDVWPELAGQMLTSAQKVLATGEPLDAENALFFIRRSADGPLQPAYFTFSYSRVVPDDKPYLLVLATETTAEHKAREAAGFAAHELEVIEQRYRSLFSSMSEGVAVHRVVYDDNGTPVDYVIENVNPSYERIAGIRFEDALGKRASELYGTGEAPYLEVYAKVAATGEPTQFETYFPPLDKHFSISVFSPSPGRFATVFADVTDRRRVEAELQSRIEDLEPDDEERG